MNVTLAQVKSFVTVARYSSFTQAAQVLHISQPALSAQVQQLEGFLKLRLFDRDTRHVTLTPSGRALAPVFQNLLTEFEDVISNAQDIVAGQYGIVRLACVPSVATTYLPEAIVRFRKRHPHIQFDVRDTNGESVVKMIQSNEVEFGITNDDRNWPDLDAVELYEDAMHVVFPKGHPIAALEKVAIEDVTKYPLILLSRYNYSRTTLDAFSAAAGSPLAPACEVMHTPTAIGLVHAGLGVALLASLAIDASRFQQFEDLQSRPIESPGLTRRIRLIRKTGCSLSPSVQIFSELIRQVVVERAC